MSYNYVAPLRRAVSTCLGYDAPWSEETVQEISGVSRRAVRMYLTQLIDRSVVVRTTDGSLMAGPRSAEYRAERPKTRAGGNSSRYRAARRQRETLAAREWHARREGLTSVPVEVGQLETQEPVVAEESLLKISAVAKRLDVHPRTVRRWILGGKLRGTRLPNGEYRALRSSVEELVGCGG